LCKFDLMKKQYREAVTELKWLGLINKLLFEDINRTEASGVTYKL